VAQHRFPGMRKSVYCFSFFVKISKFARLKGAVSRKRIALPFSRRSQFTFEEFQSRAAKYSVKYSRYFDKRDFLAFLNNLVIKISL